MFKQGSVGDKGSEGKAGADGTRVSRLNMAARTLQTYSLFNLHCNAGFPLLSNIYFLLYLKGLPGPVGPVGSAGPNGDKVSSKAQMLECSLNLEV